MTVSTAKLGFVCVIRRLRRSVGRCGAAHWAGLFESGETRVFGQAAGLIGRRGPMGRPTTKAVATILRHCFSLVALALGWAGTGVVIDRVAIVAGNRVIKDSDITRDIRITSFLNIEKPDFSPKSRRSSAHRLVDQLFIRSEIEAGQYPVVPPEADVERLLAQTSRDRLSEYGISEEELTEQLRWQLTVLRFVELRFRPSVLVSDEDIQKYRREHPNTAGKERNEIEEAIAEERVNQNFYNWLDRRRKEMKIAYREEELR